MVGTQSILYWELEFVCLAMLLLISVDIGRHTNRYLLDQKLFLALLATNALILVIDGLMYLCEGRPGRTLHVVYELITVGYYVTTPMVCVLWCLYVDYYINRSRERVRRLVLPLLSVTAVIACLAVGSVFTSILFTISQDNVYHRGAWFASVWLLSSVYLIYAVLYTLKHRKKLPRKEFVALMLFPLPPVLGGLAQALHYGVLLLWPCGAIALLMVYISIQNNRLSTDYLTDLYNRRQLDSYLRAKSQSAGGKTMAGIMIDINDFKTINDTFGHDVGDKALQDVAGILHQTFRRNDFVARYGGDEFVIILEVNGREDLERAMERLHDNLARYNEGGKRPYQLSLGIGYDCYSPQNRDASDFLRHIDRLMYQDKQKKCAAKE